VQAKVLAPRSFVACRSSPTDRLSAVDLRGAPGSTHDLTAARGAGSARALSARRPWAAGTDRQGLPRRRDRRAPRYGDRPAGRSCTPTPAPTTNCSPRYGHRPNAPTRSSAAGGPWTGWPSAPGRSASSRPPHLCSHQCSEVAG